MVSDMGNHKPKPELIIGLFAFVLYANCYYGWRKAMTYLKVSSCETNTCGLNENILTYTDCAFKKDFTPPLI